MFQLPAHLRRLTRGVLKNRNFAVFLPGAAISMQGLWIQRIAVGWLAWTLTESEFWVGAIAFAEFFPVAVFGPVFGVLADRWNRQRLAIVANAVMLLTAAVLALLIWLDAISIELLAFLTAIQGTASAAYTPVRMTLVPSLVSRADLPSALAMTSILFNLSRFTGPVVGGIVIAMLGVEAAFALNSLSYLALIVSLSIIRVDNPVLDTKPGRVLAQLLDGIRYARSHRLIAMLLAISALTSVCGRGVIELMPAVADRVFDGGSAMFAALTSATGLGAVLAGLWLSINRVPALLRLVTGIGPVVLGIVIVSMSFVTQPFVGLVIVGLIGASITFAGIGTQTLMQVAVQEDYRGRVSGIWGMVSFGGAALGGVTVGALARFMGLTQAIVICGSVCFILAVAIARKFLPDTAGTH